MKIYNHLIIDIGTGAVLSADSYEYNGPLALCGGGSSAPPPVMPTATERALQEEQLDMLRDQRKAQAELEPFMLESMGYKRGEDGGIIKIENRPEDVLMRKSMAMSGYDMEGNRLSEDQMFEYMTDAEKREYDLQKSTHQRQQDAFDGKLAISPALEQHLSKEESQAQEVLARKLGKDWALSTSGQNLTKNLQEKNNLIREEARRGMITDMEGVNASKNAININNNATKLNLAGTFNNSNTQNLSRMMGFSSGKTQGWNEMMDMSNKLGGERAQITNWSQQNAANNAAQRSANTQSAIGAGTALVTTAATLAAL